MAYREKTLHSETVYQGGIFKLRRDTVLAVNGREAYRNILEHHGAAVMLALLPEGQILLVRQWRQALGSFVLELPAGKRDPGESFAAAAARELREETGYTAGRISPLLTIHPSVGYSSEELRVFLCQELVSGETDFDDTEDLDLLAYTPDELIRMIRQGEITDAKTVAGILYGRTAGLY